MEDVYEPLERYAKEFRDKFAANTKAYFQQLLKKSAVNPTENEKLASEVYRLESEKGNAEKSRGHWAFAIIVCIILLIGGVILIFVAQGDSVLLVTGIGIALLGLVLLFPCLQKHKSASKLVEHLLGLVAQARDKAFANMEHLNRLYHWYILNDLVEQTVPLLHFDAYCPVSRIRQMQAQFDLNAHFAGDNESVLTVQSGVIHGNPFAFVREMEMQWGQETYTGSLIITWTERETDSEGHSHNVTRSETLTASVTKPIPRYGVITRLLYGNDAAPDLTFSREPSEYSGKEDSFLAKMGKKRELKNLQKFARNLDDDSNFTMMSNEDFEVLFHAKDRNDEVQFRLLFTPLAQRQMVNLLNDTKIGYGDDFTFEKCRKMNIVTPFHLRDAILDGNPERFYDFDLKRAEETFQKVAERYFRDVYFAFAPLLTIPLYQQTKTHEEIYRSVLGQPPSQWEYESLVNYHGEKHYAHPDSVTRNILKTRNISESSGTACIKVTAYGYRGVPRTEYVSKYGGDGRWHDVPVKWTEYLPVQRTTELELTGPDTNTKEEDLRNGNLSQNCNKKSAERIYRRALSIMKQP